MGRIYLGHQNMQTQGNMTFTLPILPVKPSKRFEVLIGNYDVNPHLHEVKEPITFLVSGNRQRVSSLHCRMDLGLAIALSQELTFNVSS